MGANPLSRVDGSGLWSLSIEAYSGLGGGLSISYQNGTLEVLGRIGFGLGGGVSFEPSGGPSEQSKSCGSGIIARTSATAALAGGLGPFSAATQGTIASGNAIVNRNGGGFTSISTPQLAPMGQKVTEAASDMAPRTASTLEVTQLVKFFGLSAYKILALVCIALVSVYFFTYYLNSGKNHSEIENSIREDAAIHSTVGAVQSVKIISRTKVEAGSNQEGYVSYRANVQGERKSIIVKINIKSSDSGPPVIMIVN